MLDFLKKKNTGSPPSEEGANVGAEIGNEEIIQDLPPEEPLPPEMPPQEGEYTAEPPDDEDALPSRKYKYVLQNQRARRSIRSRRIIWICAIIVFLTLILGAIAYGIISLIDYNNSKIMLDRNEANILSLSKDPSFSKGSEVISINGPQYMDNTSLEFFQYDLERIQAAEGDSSGADYVACTFYLKNVTDDTQYIYEQIDLDGITKDLDSAVRIMLIRNGEATVYAKTSSTGKAEEVVPGQNYTKNGQPNGEVWYTKPFATSSIAFSNRMIEMAPQEIVKYTLIIWLEGWDEDCVDSKLGGTVRVSLKIGVEE